MHRLRIAILIVSAVAGGALVNYETVSKAPVLLGGKVPGWLSARRAQRAVSYRRLTGVPPLDHLLHEGDEAVFFYRDLLR